MVLASIPSHWSIVVAYTDPDDRALIDAWPNVYPVQVANNPLGAKWQAAVDYAHHIEHDWLCITGSDDVIEVDEEALAATLEGCDMAGLWSWNIYDGKHTYLATYTHRRQPLGAGRFYSRRILVKMRYHLFDVTREKHLDDTGYRNALRCGAVCRLETELAGLKVVSLKGLWEQINPMSKIMGSRNVKLEPVEDVRDRSDYGF